MQLKRSLRSLGALALWMTSSTLPAHEPHQCPPTVPDHPRLKGHVEHFDIVGGQLRLRDVFDAGEALFVEPLNICDGQGRHAATGTGEKRSPVGQPAMIRTSGPDANACAGCHNQPRSGGGGDFVANVFVLAQAADPVIESIGRETSNERNTLGMFGSGPIEMLAREMSEELKVQVEGLPDGRHTLTTKGIEFEIEIAGGVVVASAGIDLDLVVKPFHQAGVVVSLREFTVNAFNHHHGMQAEERFDLNPTKGFDADHDEDGVTRELTIGDITAAVLWQAQLAVPGRLLPSDPEARERVTQGELLFSDIGCASCHVPELELTSTLFVEPNPFNPPGTCIDPAFCPPYAFDLTREGEAPRLKASAGGGARVAAYTDLKRHNLCDEPDAQDAIRYYCNEQLAQGRPDQNGRPGTEYFLTRKLWDVGNSAPYGHRGDLSTIAEAVLMHGGEARAARDAFAALPTRRQRAIVDFLRTLQVLPEGSPRIVIDNGHGRAHGEHLARRSPVRVRRSHQVCASRRCGSDGSLHLANIAAPTTGTPLRGRR